MAFLRKGKPLCHLTIINQRSLQSNFSSLCQPNRKHSGLFKKGCLNEKKRCFLLNRIPLLIGTIICTAVDNELNSTETDKKQIQSQIYKQNVKDVYAKFEQKSNCASSGEGESGVIKTDSIKSSKQEEDNVREKRNVEEISAALQLTNSSYSFKNNLEDDDSLKEADNAELVFDNQDSYLMIDDDVHDEENDEQKNEELYVPEYDTEKLNEYNIVEQDVHSNAEQDNVEPTLPPPFLETEGSSHSRKRGVVSSLTLADIHSFLKNFKKAQQSANKEKNVQHKSPHHQLLVTNSKQKRKRNVAIAIRDKDNNKDDEKCVQNKEEDVAGVDSASTLNFKHNCDTDRFCSLNKRFRSPQHDLESATAIPSSLDKEVAQDQQHSSIIHKDSTPESHKVYDRQLFNQVSPDPSEDKQHDTSNNSSIIPGFKIPDNNHETPLNDNYSDIPDKSELNSADIVSSLKSDNSETSSINSFNIKESSNIPSLDGSDSKGDSTNLSKVEGNHHFDEFKTLNTKDEEAVASSGDGGNGRLDELSASSLYAYVMSLCPEEGKKKNNKLLDVAPLPLFSAATDVNYDDPFGAEYMIRFLDALCSSSSPSSDTRLEHSFGASMLAEDSPMNYAAAAEAMRKELDDAVKRWPVKLPGSDERRSSDVDDPSQLNNRPGASDGLKEAPKQSLVKSDTVDGVAGKEVSVTSNATVGLALQQPDTCHEPAAAAIQKDESVLGYFERIFDAVVPYKKIEKSKKRSRFRSSKKRNSDCLSSSDGELSSERMCEKAAVADESLHFEGSKSELDIKNTTNPASHSAASPQNFDEQTIRKRDSSITKDSSASVPVPPFKKKKVTIQLGPPEEIPDKALTSMSHPDVLLHTDDYSSPVFDNTLRNVTSSELEPPHAIAHEKPVLKSALKQPPPAFKGYEEENLLLSSPSTSSSISKSKASSSSQDSGPLTKFSGEDLLNVTRDSNPILSITQPSSDQSFPSEKSKSDKTLSDSYESDTSTKAKTLEALLDSPKESLVSKKFDSRKVVSESSNEDFLFLPLKPSKPSESIKALSDSSKEDLSETLKRSRKPSSHSFEKYSRDHSNSDKASRKSTARSISSDYSKESMAYNKSKSNKVLSDSFQENKTNKKSRKLLSNSFNKDFRDRSSSRDSSRKSKPRSISPDSSRESVISRKSKSSRFPSDSCKEDKTITRSRKTSKNSSSKKNYSSVSTSSESSRKSRNASSHSSRKDYEDSSKRSKSKSVSSKRPAVSVASRKSKSRKLVSDYSEENFSDTSSKPRKVIRKSSRRDIADSRIKLSKVSPKKELLDGLPMISPVSDDSDSATTITRFATVAEVEQQPSIETHGRLRPYDGESLMSGLTSDSEYEVVRSLKLKPGLADVAERYMRDKCSRRAAGVASTSVDDSGGLSSTQDKVNEDLPILPTNSFFLQPDFNATALPNSSLQLDEWERNFRLFELYRQLRRMVGRNNDGDDGGGGQLITRFSGFDEYATSAMEHHEGGDANLLNVGMSDELDVYQVSLGIFFLLSCLFLYYVWVVPAFTAFENSIAPWYHLLR